MPDRHSAPRHRPASDEGVAHSSSRRSAIIARLARTPHVGGLSLTALRTIAAFRVLAICSEAGREPLAEISMRFRSVCAAGTFLAFADAVGRTWPESVQFRRPRCPLLSPDEATLARLVDHASTGDRLGFGIVLDGFVRPDRHDALFSAAVAFAAALSAGPRGEAGGFGC